MHTAGCSEEVCYVCAQSCAAAHGDELLADTLHNAERRKHQPRCEHRQYWQDAFESLLAAKRVSVLCCAAIGCLG